MRNHRDGVEEAARYARRVRVRRDKGHAVIDAGEERYQRGHDDARNKEVRNVGAVRHLGAGLESEIVAIETDPVPRQLILNIAAPEFRYLEARTQAEPIAVADEARLPEIGALIGQRDARGEVPIEEIRLREAQIDKSCPRRALHPEP